MSEERKTVQPPPPLPAVIYDVPHMVEIDRFRSIAAIYEQIAIMAEDLNIDPNKLTYSLLKSLQALEAIKLELNELTTILDNIKG